MNDTVTDPEVQRLRTRVAALEQTQEGQESALRELRERNRQLANSEDALREQTRILQSVVSNMADGVIVADAQGTFLLFNPAAERILRMGNTSVRPEDWSRQYGCYLPDAVTPYPSADLPLARAIRGEEVSAAEIFVRHHNAPDGVWLGTNARPLRDEGGALRGGVVVMHDITSRKRAECRRAGQYAVTHVLAESVTLDEAAARVLAAVGDSTGWDFGVVWEVDDVLRVLRCVDTWRRPGLDCDAFDAESRETSFPAGVGLPGRVLAGGQALWVADVTRDPNFPRAASALGCGLRGAIAFPILRSSGAVGGVLEFFSRSFHRPDDDLLALFAALGSQVGQFIERRQAEEDLRRQRERFELAVRGSGDGLWDWDIVNDELYLSPRWKALLGYEDDEIPNAFGEWEKRLHPDDRDRARDMIQAYFDDPNAPYYELEHRLRHKNGTYRWILARGLALRDAEGRPLRMAGSHTDITALKDMIHALRDSEALYHSLVETLPLNMFRKDLDGHFTFANRLFCKTMGRPLAEILGKTDHDFFPQALADKYRVDDLRVAATRELFEATEEHLRPDGGKIYVQVLKTPVYDSLDKVVGVQGIFWDVTDRKRAEEALLKAREAAEAANRSKSEFLANMSHEIRTPMNAVIGMTELLLDTTLTAEQREYLDMVRASADSLLTVINDILDFSKIEAGKLDLDRTPFGLADLVGDALKTLAVRAHAKGLELAFRLAPGVPEAVVGDPHRLRQVLVNLIGNSVKFTERGEVIVEVRDAAGEGDGPPPGYRDLQFSVIDTGIGIPADKLGMIFDPFSQVDGSTTRKYGGTGLGLAICGRLVTMMGGRLGVDSEAGKGSRFHFTARFEAAKAPPARPAPPERLRGLSVLVVDDNATNRLILEETLSGWDMRPTAVAGGDEALAALEGAARAGRPFGLVLLDAQMPGMDGFGLAACIQQRPELVGATLMMLSSGGHSGVLARRRELGITGYLTKPLKQADLWRAILEALGNADQEAHKTKTVSPQEARAADAPRRLRLLLAEDNLFNQKLATGLLEKEGHSVVVANNGKEALAILERDPAFDVVLMDVQMPEMDGLEATAALRRREAGTGRRLPILAMTAYAMKGDRERCLDAGMDGYISKPIRARELLDAVAGLTAKAPEAPPEAPALPPEEAPDWAAAEARVGGDKQHLAELVRIFLGQCPGWVEELRRGVAAGDAAPVKTAAHNLKSCLGSFSAQAAYDDALRLETMARGGDLSGAGDVLRALEDKLGRLRTALEAFAPV